MLLFMLSNYTRLSIMEELLAYVYLLSEDLIAFDVYENKLNEMFVKDIENEDLIELEYLSSSVKDTVVYIRTHINYNSMDINKFGRQLFDLLKPIYNTMDIENFANAMYSLWEGLAGNMQDIEPFWTLSYADDPLSWGDEKQTRKIYEKMLAYYDTRL